jgi:hypothetical protein
MMMVTGILVFAGAFAASASVFWLTLVPALPRIVALLRDGVDPVIASRPVLTVSEPRIRVRVRMVPTPTAPRFAVRAVA